MTPAIDAVVDLPENVLRTRTLAGLEMPNLVRWRRRPGSCFTWNTRPRLAIIADPSK